MSPRMAFIEFYNFPGRIASQPGFLLFSPEVPTGSMALYSHSFGVLFQLCPEDV